MVQDKFEFDLVIALSGFAKNHNKMFEVRRYVAIVPYLTRASADGHLVLINALLNASVLMLWFGGAILFTVLRGFMMRIASPEGDSSITPDSNVMTVYFRFLAGVLGNSTGASKLLQRADSFLMFVVGVFATITSLLFTGAVFEQLIVIDPPKQINTLDDLIASNISVVICHRDLNLFEDRYIIYVMFLLYFYIYG